MSERLQHLDDGDFQSYLEGELDGVQRSEVEGHLATCARCSAQVEGWRMLLEELESLPALMPSVEFRDRVLGSLPSQKPKATGLWSRLQGAIARRGLRARQHLTPDSIQDLLDGVTAGLAPSRMRGHLAACTRCRQEFSEWARLHASLDRLGRLGPSLGFAHAVMRRVDLSPRRAAAPSLASRLFAAARALLPSTRGGWTLAGTVVTAPALGILAVLAFVLAHPLLTVQGLLAFGVWRVSAAAQAGFSWVAGQFTGSAVAFQGYALIEAVMSSPGMALGGILAIWATVIAAAWILYRNVVAPSFIASRHG